MTHQYTPETQALLAAVQSGDVCPECGAANHLEHFDECVRHPENADVVARAKAALEGVTVGEWHAYDGRETANSATFVSSRVGPVCWMSARTDVEMPAAVDAEFIAAARTLVPELVAEVERLHSWDGLMSLVDEHYPEDIFPTMDDTERRDPGPRIISLLRQLSRLDRDNAMFCSQLDGLFTRVQELTAEVEELRVDKAELFERNRELNGRRGVEA